MIERTLPPFFVVRRQGYIWGYCLLDLWLTPLVALWHLLIVPHKLKWFKIDYKVCVRVRARERLVCAYCADSFEMCVSIVLFMCIVYTIQYTQRMHCIYMYRDCETTSKFLFPTVHQKQYRDESINYTETFFHASVQYKFSPLGARACVQIYAHRKRVRACG